MNKKKKKNKNNILLKVTLKIIMTIIIASCLIISIKSGYPIKSIKLPCCEIEFDTSNR